MKAVIFETFEFAVKTRRGEQVLEGFKTFSPGANKVMFKLVYLASVSLETIIVDGV
jgi:hypothetical protein